MKELTRRQTEVLAFLHTFIDNHGYPPTMREIARHFDISVKAISDHLKALERKNQIRCDFNRSRAIELVHSPSEEKNEMAEIPLLGSVAAGKPLFAEENMERMLAFPASSLKAGNYFALHVKGDSMQGAGILDGDTAIFIQRSTANNGDIVVARVNEDAVTLKKFFHEKNRIKLKAENPVYPPIYSQNVTVLGKLEFLIRNYN